MTTNRRIQGLLREVNHCRRLWRAWNSHMLTKRPADPKHWGVQHKFLVDEIKDALSFRFIVRLYALMEDDNTNKRKKFTFGFWLDSLRSDPVVDEVRKKYAELAGSDDYETLQKKRHNFLAHNALQPRNFPHSYTALFQMSEKIEGLYGLVVGAGLALPIPWTCPLDARVVHQSNCAEGIEVNVAEFFRKLK